MTSPRPLTLATWNINSVRLRMPLLGRLVAEAQPDVICLQETKAPVELLREAVGLPHRRQLRAFPDQEVEIPADPATVDPRFLMSPAKADRLEAQV